jgi:diaminopimelate decarboxylase
MPAPRVLIRVTPAVSASTHPSIRTGHAESKFGVALAGGRADALARRMLDSSRLRLSGVHVHIGSQIVDMDPLERAVDAAAAFAVRIDAEELVVGGGLGVSYRACEPTPTISAWAKATRARAQTRGFCGRVMAEPGRALIATAGVTIYTIGAVKTAGSTTFLAVDGGISDNPRPAMYQAEYQPILVRHPYVGHGGETYTVVGKNCESGDTFARNVAIRGNPRTGDLLCMPVTGAYCHAMSSRYNGLLRPPVVLIDDGNARLIVRRERLEDLLGTDLFG